MIRRAVVATLVVATAARAGPAEVPRVVVPAAAPPTAPLDLGPRVIHRAIVDSRDPADDVRATDKAAFGGAGGSRGRVDRAFDDVAVPTCLTPAALAHDRPTVGAFGLGGFLVLPSWAHAIVTGRCRHCSHAGDAPSARDAIHGLIAFDREGDNGRIVVPGTRATTRPRPSRRPGASSRCD